MKYTFTISSFILLTLLSILSFQASHEKLLGGAKLLNESNEKQGLLFDGPDKALFQNFIMLRDPNENRIPYERLEPLRHLDANARRANRDFNWQGLDTNIPGRGRALYLHSSSGVLYTGSVSGGLWMNADYKQNARWEQLQGFEGLAVNCIVSDPADDNILYLGTGESFTAFVNYRESTAVGNGIYRSTDGGKNWEHMASTEEFYFVNDMAVRIENGQSILYVAVGSGEYETKSFVQEGLYRTSNVGEDWSQVLPNVPGSDRPYQVSDIEINGNNRLFVGTMRNTANEGASKILYSDDGQQWLTYEYSGYDAEIVNLLDNEGFVTGRSIVKSAPSNPNHLYALFTCGAVNSLGQLKSILVEMGQSQDGGVTWTEIPDYRTFYNNHIFSLPWHAMALTVDPKNENKIVIGGLDAHVLHNTAAEITELDYKQLTDWYAMYTSNDPDLTEEEREAARNRYVHADIHDIQFLNDGSEEVLITTDGGVFYTTNMNASIDLNEESPATKFPVIFQAVNNALNTTQYYSAAINPKEGVAEVMGGTQDNGTILQTYEGPQTTSKAISGGDGAFCFYDRDDEVKITMFYNNNYFVHYNGEVKYPRGTYAGLFINPVAYDDESNLAYYNMATSKYGGIKSFQDVSYDSIGILNVNKFIDRDDHGLDTLTFIDLNVDLREAITALRLVSGTRSLNKSLVFGTEAGQVFLVEGLPNNAEVFKIDGGSLPKGYISSIDVDWSGESILVTFSNFGLSSVWLTRDRGFQWTPIERNLPDMPVRWGRFNPEDDNKIMIATELGMWGLEDVGNEKEQWQQYNTGLPRMRIDMFDLRASDKAIVVGTHGQGFYVGTYEQGVVPGDITSIQDSHSNERGSFYPNPVHSTLHYKGRHGAQIIFRDLSGGKVLSATMPESQSLDVSGLSAGTYIATVYDNIGNAVWNERIVRR